MAEKTDRKLTVTYVNGHNYKAMPAIMLKGLWLEKLGFETGAHVDVKCSDGKIIITKAGEQ